MIIPLTDNQIKRIVNNIVAACKDITKLNKTGYNFIYLASRFIAHYDLHGFIAHYSDEGNDLKTDILQAQSANQWNNFRPGEQNYEYYMSKKRCYNAIVDKLLETIT